MKRVRSKFGGNQNESNSSDDDQAEEDSDNNDQMNESIESRTLKKRIAKTLKFSHKPFFNNELVKIGAVNF